MDGFFSIISELRGWVDQVGVPDWMITPLIALGLTMLVDLVLWLSLKPLERRLKASPNRWDDVLVAAVRAPLRAWVWLMGLTVIAMTLGLHFDQDWLTGRAPMVSKLLTLVLIGWLGWRFIARIEQRMVFPPGNSKGRALEKTTTDALTKVFGAVLLTILVLCAMNVLGVSISGVLAFGGFGGLVAGFAARDLLANFFGGMVVHVDRPFKVGDWIRSPDREIEGIVEDIGWRLTRIRTFPGPLLYVPNAIFSQVVVENPSRMANRRIWETLSIRYEDASAVDGITQDIDEMLNDLEGIDRNDVITVKLTSFGPYSLDIMVYALTVVTDWQHYHEIKQHVLLKVRDIVEEHGASLALPVSKIQMASNVAVEMPERSDSSKMADSTPSAPSSPPRDRQRGGQGSETSDDTPTSQQDADDA